MRGVKSMPIFRAAVRSKGAVCIAPAVAVLAVLLAWGVRISHAEVVISDMTSRQQAQRSAALATPAAGLEHESFVVREDVLEGFIVNTSSERKEDVTVEIRSTSDDELQTLWMARVELGDMDPGQRRFIRRSYPLWLPEPQKLVFDFDPPADTEMPWPRPVPAVNLRYSGAGSGATSWFILVPGEYRVVYSYAGSGEMGLEIRSFGSGETHTLGRLQHADDGVFSLNVTEQGTHQLFVRADNAWTLSITPAKPGATGQTASRGQSGRPGPVAIQIEEPEPGHTRIVQQ